MATPVNAESIMAKEHLSDSSNSVAVEPIALSVKRFLSSRNGENTNSQASRIVMDHVTVEGSGTGVSRDCS